MDKMELTPSRDVCIVHIVIPPPCLLVTEDGCGESPASAKHC